MSLTDHTKGDLNEKLLHKHDHDEGLSISTEELWYYPIFYTSSDLFHPDNIKNYHQDGGKISISLHDYWTKYGGPQGLARKLKTHLKVCLLSKSTINC